MRSFFVCLIAGLSALAGCSQDQNASSASAQTAPQAARKELLPPDNPIQRCINLGNGLDAPYEGAWTYRIEDAHIFEIARAGFDTVRLPVRWDTRSMKSAPYTIEPEFFDRVDHIIDLALSEGLQVVLDMHHYNPMYEDPAGQEPRFLAMWSQIAEHYQDYPETLIFEPLNEPIERLTNRRLETLFPKVMKIIRSSNPNRWVILSGDNWGSLDGLLGVRLPEDPRTIWSFHSYGPYEFTYQGAPFAGRDLPTGVTWGTRSEYDQITARARRVAAHGAIHQKPIFLGEFGAYAADGESPRASRIAWLTHMRRTAETHNIGWCAWDFGAAFAFYDVEARQWDDGLLNTLLGD